MNVPFLNSLKASSSSSRLFITMGPPQTIGSFRGGADNKRKRAPSGPAFTSTGSSVSSPGTGTEYNMAQPLLSADCCLTLSLFTEAESLEYTHTLTVKPVKYLILEEQGVTATILLLSLRAPPVRMS